MQQILNRIKVLENQMKPNDVDSALRDFLSEKANTGEVRDILENATIISSIDGKRYSAKEYLGVK